MGKKVLNFGISMRVTDAVGYNEKRDSLAQDWPNYVLSVFPDEKWLFVPNIGQNVLDFVQKWELNSFILTGGEDFGASPIRDLTESLLLDYAIANNFPVLGICRGLQLIYNKFGGLVEPQNLDFINCHKATRHTIEINGESQIVNSYHNNKLVERTLPGELNILATCLKDSSIEAISGNNILGLMWHPERELKIQKWETDMIRNFFLNDV